MTKLWTRGVVAALGLLIGLPAVSSAHQHYTGVAPAAVKASLVSTHTHASATTVKHKKKKHKRKHKAKHKSALKSKASTHAKHRATNA